LFLVRPWRSRRVRAAVRIGSDNAYGIYLAQMIFISALGALGWSHFADRAPFWVWLPMTLAIACRCSPSTPRWSGCSQPWPPEPAW